MGLWKSISDRMKAKREELQRRAVRKAAETALDSAGKAVESAGKAVGRALFGDGSDDEAAAQEKAPETPPDPFAKLKAREKADKERAREEKRRDEERAAAKARLEKDVDEELAALKKKLGK